MPFDPTPTDAIQIRPARAADLSALEWDGAHAGDRAVIAETFARQHRGEALMLIAARGPSPIAQAWLDFGPGAAATLWAVRTRAGHRGRGLGARIVRRAEALAAALGRRRTEVTVDPLNGGALRFWRRHGYRATGETLVTYRTISPEGEPWRWTVPHLTLVRTLSASAGPSATCPTAASRR